MTRDEILAAKARAEAATPTSRDCRRHSIEPGHGEDPCRWCEQGYARIARADVLALADLALLAWDLAEALQEFVPDVSLMPPDTSSLMTVEVWPCDIDYARAALARFEAATNA